MLIQHGSQSFRRAGAIPTIKQERYPQRVIVFDTEAYRSSPVEGVELQTLRAGVATYLELDALQELSSQEYYNFTTTEQLGEFIEYHTRKDKSLFVYAHNLKYDLQLSGVYTWLLAQGWQSKLFVIEDPPTFIKLRRGRMSITLVDTFNYWQFSVEAMGEQLGLPKLSINFNSCTDEQLFIYCKRDVEVLAQYLISFIHFLRDNQLCGLGLTLASQAFRSFRHRLMQDEVILHNDERALQLERDGYYGGRVEAFHIGELSGESFYKLDVNSMYPYIMKESSFPVELVAYAEHIPLNLLAYHLRRYYCLAEVELSIKQPCYAYSNGIKLLFPIGEFTAVLHHVDLDKAYQRGEVRAVRRIALYKRGDVFTRYVKFFYALKLQAEAEGDKITRQQAKIFLNSLYGKFGQREVVSKILPNTGVKQYNRMSGYSETLRQTVEVNYLGEQLELRYKGGESCYSSPVIAGAVTAYARAYLWDLIQACGTRNVFYVDTDSLIVNQEGYERITPYLDISRLGYLKLEGVANNLIIYGAKDYQFGAEVKLKGIPKKARKLSDNLWEYEQFRGAKTWLHDGLETGVKIYTRLKARKGTYDKGIILPNGSVLPWCLHLADKR